MLARMMLAGLPVRADAVDELAVLVRGAGADVLADRTEGRAGRPKPCPASAQARTSH